MLHVILFILKLIGCLILGIIILIALLIAAILISPFRYQMKGYCDREIKNLEVSGKFSYLFHLIEGKMNYEKEQFIWELKVAWIRKSNAPEVQEDRKFGLETETESEEREQEKKVMTAMETKPNLPEHKKVQEKIVQEETTIDAQKEETMVNTKRENPEKGQNRKESKKQIANEKKEKESQEIKKSSILDKLKSVGQTLMCTIRKVCDKIKSLIRKKEILVTFITEETHMAAWKKVIGEIKKLLKKCCPQDVRGKIRFGFEDPSVTGKLLAAAGIIYPLIGEHVEIYPDFEEVVLDGDLSVKGRVRLSSVAKMAWNLVWNKSVRKTIRDIMKFSFDEGGTGNG